MKTSPHRGSRYIALAATLALAASATACTAATDDAASDVAIDFETVTVTDLSTMLESGEVSAVSLAEAYVDRIEAVNTSGPSLRGVQSIISTWKEQAEESDARRESDDARGPLDGVPVIVKDNFDIEGEVTSAGSLALADNVATSNSVVVDKLEEAGAVVIAKATMVEFAFWNGGSSWGYSSLGGQPLNPYDASFETSGSSSGSGIAAAAGLAAITFGSDTGGSVITPSERMSLVGYRPSTGLISRTGIVPITTFSDTAGVMGRSVEDVAIGAAAIAGVDESDPATLESAAFQGIDYSEHLDSASLDGARVGVVQPADASDDELELWNATVAAVEAQGATIVPVDMELTPFPFTTTTYEFRENLDEYLATRTADDFAIKSVEDLADFYRGNPGDTQKYGASTLFDAEAVDLEADRANAESDLETARNDAQAKVDDLFGGQAVDVLLFSQPSPVHLFAPIIGLPEITVPVGYGASDRHPYGAVLVGERWGDSDLFSYASALESVLPDRSAPSEINPTMWRCLTSRESEHCLP